MRVRLAIVLLSIVPLIACTTKREKESLLRNHLFSMRASVTQYTLDHERAPLKLEELVSAKYLKEIPPDPMTGKPDWEVIMEDALMSVDQTQPGIWDVKSTSTAVSTEGSAYNTW